MRRAAAKPRSFGRGRSKTTTISPRQEVVILSVLANGLTPVEACRIAGVSLALVKKHRSHDPAFDQQWLEAYDTGVASLEHVAQQRALGGSDPLLMFLLKARKPAVYRERHALDITNHTMSTDDLARARALGHEALVDDEKSRALELVAAMFADVATARAAGVGYGDAAS